MTRYAGLSGTVYLTGAGPGSAKLLTVRVVEVLKSADIVFHAPAHVAVNNVGKRCGPKKISQEQIQEKMVLAARSGQTVVRLKGGDPLVFGPPKKRSRRFEKIAYRLRLCRA
jgi:siroheme synthase